MIERAPEVNRAFSAGDFLLYLPGALPQAVNDRAPLALNRCQDLSSFGHSSFLRHSSFVLRHYHSLTTRLGNR